MDENSLKELFPKLQTTFDHLSSKHPTDFDVTLKRIISGDVEKTHYVVKVEAAQKANVNETKHCEVAIFANVIGEFSKVDVKCEHHDKSFRYMKPWGSVQFNSASKIVLKDFE